MFDTWSFRKRGCPLVTYCHNNPPPPCIKMMSQMSTPFTPLRFKECDKMNISFMKMNTDSISKKIPWKGIGAGGAFFEQNNLTKNTGCLNKYNKTLLYWPRTTLIVNEIAWRHVCVSISPHQRHETSRFRRLLHLLYGYGDVINGWPQRFWFKKLNNFIRVRYTEVWNQAAL